MLVKKKFLTTNVSLKAGFKSRINNVSLILQCISDRPVAKISKLSHLIFSSHRLICLLLIISIVNYRRSFRTQPIVTIKKT